MPAPRIAFLGAGIMGTRMVQRLLSSGFPVTVYNRNREKAEALVSDGASVADSPREAAAGADIVLSMVADDQASREIWMSEPDGVLAAQRSVSDGSAVLIESSTLTVGWVRELAAAAQARGCQFIDAPVTGSRNQAAAGELNFLVGGPPEVVERVRPVLEAMGRSIIHLGPVGSGALVKLINNFVCGVQVASLAEAVAIIERSDLDRAQTMAVLTDGAPGSPLFKTVASRMTTPDFTPNFKLSLMAKDLGYAAEEGERLAVPMTSASAALEVFRRAIEAGLADSDMAAVVRLFRRD